CATGWRIWARSSRSGTNDKEVEPYMTKRVYFFGGGTAEGNGQMRELLGGKGANLAEMTLLGIPVPPGFTITTEMCTAYYALGKRWPEGLEEEIKANLK